MVSSGWDTIETCDASTSVIVAPARSAMLRWVAGGMTRSSVPMTAQLGIDFHAAVSVGSDVGSEGDRPLAGGDQPTVGLGEVLCEGVVDGGRLEERLDVAFGCAGVAGEVEHGGGIGHVERGARSAEDVEDALADVGDEGVDVDERPDVAAAGPGVGDHDTAVRVADEDHGPAGALGEERRDIRSCRPRHRGAGSVVSAP